MNKILVTMMLISVVLTACQEYKETTTPDLTAVEFTFADLENGRAYTQGDTVFLEGTISWENELHGYEITLTSIHSDSVVMTNHNHIDAKRIYVHTMWINNLTYRSDMRLTVDAFKTHDGGNETKEIVFHCHPK